MALGLCLGCAFLLAPGPAAAGEPPAPGTPAAAPGPTAAPAAADAPTPAAPAAERPAHHPADAGANEHASDAVVGGLEVHLRLFHPDAAVADKAMRGALGEIRRIHRKMTAGLRGSEIASLNHIGGREEMIVSSETFDLLTHALRLCRETARAYDPTVQSFDYLWNFSRRPFVRPLPDELKARLAIAGCDKVVLKPGRRVRFLQEGVRVTLEDVVIGHTLQTVATRLRAEGVSAFRLRIGHDIYVHGRSGTRHWYAAVGHPLDPAKTVVQLYLGAQAAATRSIHERFFFKGGERYHDVLDPRTGRPARGVVQATVISTDAVEADALSRAVLVMGVKEGLAYLARQPHAEGFLIDDKGAVHGSKGMADYGRLPARIEL